MPSETSTPDKELIEAYRTAGEIMWWIGVNVPIGRIHMTWLNNSFEFTWIGRVAERQYGIIESVSLAEIEASRQSAEEHGLLISRRFNNLITESIRKEGVH